MNNPDPQYEEEYWNALYYYQCLDDKHRRMLLKELNARDD